MRNTITLITILFTLFSCGKKEVKTDETYINTTANYVAKIDSNSNLTEKLTEGTLTDKDGLKDVGRFKYNVLFDKRSKELFRIINTETSNKTVKEHYYFHNHNLVYIVSSTYGQPDKKIYTQGFKKVIAMSNVSESEKNVLLDKAIRFKNAHYRIDD
ncbi:hypothetical protein [Psychroserpens sp. MEBiC05023]